MLTDGTGLAVAVLVGFATAQFGTFATTVYLHRTVTHRAMTMRPGLAFVFRVVVWMTSGQAPRQWAAVHRKHHAYSDVEGDPHSPVLLGWKHVQLHNVRLYRRVAQDDEQVRRYARDVRPDRWDRGLFDRGLLGLGLTVVLLVAVLGPVAGLLAFAVHVVSYVQLNASINAITHTFGAQPYHSN